MGEYQPRLGKATTNRLLKYFMTRHIIVLLFSAM